MPNEPRDELDLVRALRAGSPDAVATLYADYGEHVLRWVIRLGGASIDAEDTAHEVFVVALRGGGAFRGDARVRTWLFGVTRRVVANARRRAAIRRFVGLESIAEPAAQGAGADQHLAGRQARRRVQACLDALSQIQREVLVLADLEGHTAPEVAELLQIPAGTVYSRLHGARRAFAEALSAAGLGPDGHPVERADGSVVPLRSRR